MDLKKIVDFIFEAATVNRFQRTGWQFFGDNHETVGSHTFMTAVIAYFLGKKIGANMEKILTMSIFHDFHEARTGELDKIAKQYVSRDTEKANRHIFEGKSDELLALLTEYEDKQSLDARITYEANVLAFLLELKLLHERGNAHAKEWFMNNKTRLKMTESKELCDALWSTDSHVWWQDLRDVLLEDDKNK